MGKLIHLVKRVSILFGRIRRGEVIVMRLVATGATAGLIFSGVFVPANIHTNLGDDLEDAIDPIEEVTLVKNGRLTFCKLDNSSYEVVQTIKMIVTAYSSTPDQTWGDPFITASGKRVEDGIVANNMLPFGTKIRIPEIYGDKVFVVQDRLHQRKGKYHVDIWFEVTQDAREFGVKTVNIEILDA